MEQNRSKFFSEKREFSSHSCSSTVVFKYRENAFLYGHLRQ